MRGKDENSVKHRWCGYRVLGSLGRIEMRSAISHVPSQLLGKCLGETSMQVWPLVPIQRSGMDGVSQVRASYRAVSTGAANQEGKQH